MLFIIGKSLRETGTKGKARYVSPLIYCGFENSFSSRACGWNRTFNILLRGKIFQKTSTYYWEERSIRRFKDLEEGQLYPKHCSLLPCLPVTTLVIGTLDIGTYQRIHSHNQNIRCWSHTSRPCMVYQIHILTKNLFNNTYKRLGIPAKRWCTDRTNKI